MKDVKVKSSKGRSMPSNVISDKVTKFLESMWNKVVIRIGIYPMMCGSNIAALKVSMCRGGSTLEEGRVENWKIDLELWFVDTAVVINVGKVTKGNNDNQSSEDQTVEE